MSDQDTTASPTWNLPPRELEPEMEAELKDLRAREEMPQARGVAMDHLLQGLEFERQRSEEATRGKYTYGLVKVDEEALRDLIRECNDEETELLSITYVPDKEHFLVLYKTPRPAA